MALTFETYYKNKFIEITDIVEKWNISTKEVVALLNEGELFLFCLGRYNEWNNKKSDELIKFDKDNFALERHVYYGDTSLKEPFRYDNETVIKFMRQSDEEIIGYTEVLIPITKQAQQSMFNEHEDCMVYGCFLTNTEKLEQEHPEYIGQESCCHSSRLAVEQQYKERLAEKDALIEALQQELQERKALFLPGIMRFTHECQRCGMTPQETAQAMREKGYPRQIVGAVMDGGDEVRADWGKHADRLLNGEAVKQPW